MEKLDLTKKYKTYYTAKTKPEIIEVEAAQFLSITGQGDPSGKAFSEKLEALYPVAYAIKFRYKDLGKDFTVAKLEGLWSFDEAKYKDVSMEESPLKIPRSEWSYRMLIRLPDYVTQEHVKLAIEEAFAKKKIQLAKEVEVFSMKEGKCVQMLHVGPFSTEPETLKVMLDFIEKNNFKKNGLHHEIYLSDFRKTPEAKLKTILREPVK